MKLSPRKHLRNLFSSLFKGTFSFLYSKKWARDLIYTALPNNDLVLCNTDEGIKYIAHSSDEIIGRITYKDRKSYDADKLALSLKIIGSRKNTLLDLGANIGTIGIYAVSQGLAKNCIAFEPEPLNFNLLKANISLNELSDCFELHNVALASEKSDAVVFELSPSNFGDHRVRVINENGLQAETSRDLIYVPTDTLDNLVPDIDFNDCILFMDTQGFEGDVLSGAKNFIDARVPIVTEFWPYGLNRTRGTDKFYTALENGYYTTLYDLRYPDKKMDFSVDRMKKIAEELGDEGGQTDLLIF